jgi:effector-binding domain-containing protein
VNFSLKRLAFCNPYEDYPMKTFMRQSAALLLLNLVLLALGGIDAVATEEVKYRVLESSGDFELRQYESSLGAETTVEGDFHEVGNEGFRRLFDYISGKNRKKQSIPMTAPVSQEASSEKIPMTAPVNQEKVGGAWRITFLMPAAFTMETLPEPLDSRVKLVKIPGRLMAALSYSGTWSRERYEDKEQRLKEFIRQRGLKIEGEPVFARYNPPFMPWFLRRNEVLIPVGQVH